MLIDQMSEQQSPLFVVGSSGIDYALTSHWAMQPECRESLREIDCRGSIHEPNCDGPSREPTLDRGAIHDYPDRGTIHDIATLRPVEQLVVITGSCSPVNDRQIGWASNMASRPYRSMPPSD